MASCATVPDRQRLVGIAMRAAQRSRKCIAPSLLEAATRSRREVVGVQPEKINAALFEKADNAVGMRIERLGDDKDRIARLKYSKRYSSRST
jgi:hypothetical protein